jgi:hypothetical protein
VYNVGGGGGGGGEGGGDDGESFFMEEDTGSSETGKVGVNNIIQWKSDLMIKKRQN